jgi:hypothetical protein
MSVTDVTNVIESELFHTILQGDLFAGCRVLNLNSFLQLISIINV